MDQDYIFARLNALFRDFFMDDGISLKPETTALDILGWDSLANISLMLAVQKEFGVNFTSRQLDSFNNVGDLVLAISAG
jgi:acyl carrier protein